MNHEFSESQELLRSTTADFFAREYPIDRMRELMDAPDEQQRALWRAISALGWNAAPFPESVGGFPGSFLDAGVVIEEMGRAGCVSPYVHSTVATGLALDGSGAGLASAVAGSEATVIACPAAPGIALPALSGNAVDGRAAGVPFATLATHFIVPAADGGTAVVAAASAGVTATRLAGSGGEPAGAVVFAGVRPHAVLPAGLASTIQANGAAGSALFMLGLAQRALDLAVAYAQERIQFGRPIGSFQAIQHKCANMLIEIEVGRNLAYKAATAHGTDDFGRAAAYAKSYLGEAAGRVTRETIQIHGGVGFVDNHRAQLFYRLATSANALYGTPREHRLAVTALVLGAAGAH